jgi:GntR family transcriptional regulator
MTTGRPGHLPPIAQKREKSMDIIINNSSGVPIYEQIEEQIKEQILSGELREGDALPSMRVLAKDLKISIITTKRAYEDLERDGYTESVVGKGSFVKGVSAELLKENMRFAIEEFLDKAVDKALLGKISLEEMEEMLRLIYGEKAEGKR